MCVDVPARSPQAPSPARTTAYQLPIPCLPYSIQLQSDYHTRRRAQKGAERSGAVGGGAARWRWRWRCRPTSTSGTMPRTNAGSSMHNEIDTRSTEARRSHKVESTARQRSILIHTAARIYHKVPSPLSHSAHAAYGTVSALARCTGPPRPDLAQLASIGGGGAA